VEPVTGTTYLVLFFVVIVIRHREHKRPASHQLYEDWKDRIYATALLVEAFVFLGSMFLEGRIPA
jgi:hypothetical protein